MRNLCVVASATESSLLYTCAAATDHFHAAFSSSTLLLLRCHVGSVRVCLHVVEDHS
jgi:hypothetical protein